MPRTPALSATLFGASSLLLVASACGDAATDGGNPGSGGSSLGGSGAAGGGNAGRGGTGTGGAATGGSGTGGGSGGASAAGGSAGSAGAGAGSGGSAGAGGTTAGRGGSAGAGGSADAGSGGSANGGSGNPTGGTAGGGAGGATGGTAPSAGSAGKGGTAGSAGTAGSPGCTSDENPIGWASVSGDGVTATTGGLGGTTVTPANAAELLAYAESDDPLIIRIEGTFSVPRLQVNSNKTLLGVGPNATLNGGVRIRGNDGENVANVIVRNLHVNGGTSDVDDDAMQIYFAHHVWIDHCDIYDGPDGNLDITHASNWVTVSYTKFRYTSAYQRPSGEDGDHRFSNLLGHSNNNAGEDSGRLKITLHHNYWAEGVIERMPRVRFGEVHVFNNYFRSDDSNYCVGGGVEARLLVQNNYFDDVRDPHRFQEDNDTAQIVANGNTYVGVSDTTAKATRGTAFTPGYTVALAPADEALKSHVMQCAGPR